MRLRWRWTKFIKMTQLEWWRQKRDKRKAKKCFPSKVMQKGKVEGKIPTKEWKRQKAKVKAGGSKMFQPTKKKRTKPLQHRRPWLSHRSWGLDDLSSSRKRHREFDEYSETTFDSFSTGVLRDVKKGQSLQVAASNKSTSKCRCEARKLCFFCSRDCWS